MPYIPLHRRSVYRQALDSLLYYWEREGKQPGDLAYILFTLALSALTRLPKDTPRYADYALILGVLESVTEEFKGRLRYYESLKLEEAGDVQPL